MLQVLKDSNIFSNWAKSDNFVTKKRIETQENRI